jgi:hypothetical protein
MSNHRNFIALTFIGGLFALFISGCTRNVSSRVLEMDRQVSAKVHLLDHGLDQDSNRIGKLRFIGGVELTSPDRRFGGFSGMLINPDGSKLWAVSDRGNWMSADMRLNAAGLPVKLDGVKMAPLLNPDGTFVKGKSQSDAEELTLAPDGGMVVSFERHHRLLAYPGPYNPLQHNPRLIELPAWLMKQKANRGAEAMTYLADGRLFVVAEGAGGNQTAAGVWDGVSWAELRYACKPGLRPTAAALLPNGDVVLLERGFSLATGLSVRVVRLASAKIVAGALLAPEVLADLSGALPMIDNFEALAVRPSTQGAMLYMLSDDNFSAMQRTLLFLFEMRLD